MSNITETPLDQLDTNEGDEEMAGPITKVACLVWLLSMAWCVYCAHLQEQARFAQEERERIEQAEKNERERKMMPETREQVIAKTIMKKVSKEWSYYLIAVDIYALRVLVSFFLIDYSKECETQGFPRIDTGRG